MKRSNLILLASAAIAMLTATAAMAQENITLPVSLYNQTAWPAVETTVQIDSEGEEMPAYELQGWQTYKGMSRKGKVYYVPSAVDDRIILLLQDVHSGLANLPYLIDNKTNKQLIIHVRGNATLLCKGIAIRSEGPVSIYGEEAEDGAAPVSRFTLQGGSRGHAALETKGDVYAQDVYLDITSNQAPYAFLCSYTGEKEEHTLELNHVQGKVKGTKQAVMGFQSVIGSHGASVEGLTITQNIEEEVAPEEDETPNAETEMEEDQTVYTTAELMPQFADGPAAMLVWLNENVQYPNIAKEQGIQGRVIVSCIVEADGSITNATVLRSADVSLDKEALRVVKAMPKWIPGKQNGKNVRVKFFIPVHFKLTE